MTQDMTPGYARLCLPFLAALMLRDGRIDPRWFGAETFSDPLILELAATLSIVVNDNPDLNALSPQRLEVRFADGSHDMIAISQTLGSPNAPMDVHQSTAKYSLAEVLAPGADPRIFTNHVTQHGNDAGHHGGCKQFGNVLLGQDRVNDQRH